MSINKANNSIRGQWSSKLAFILSSTGAAVGLGNIWKFPYEVATDGGSAFVLTYIILLCIVGIPILIAEMLLGKIGRASPYSALYRITQLSKAHKKWPLLGWLSVITLTLVLSFYSVVAGWSIIYFFSSISGKLVGLSISDISQFWHNIMHSPWQMLGCHALFMLITISIVIRGVNKGLEKANNIMMPMLFICLLILVVYATQTPGLHQGLSYLFAFKYQLINLQTIVKALGQTCFTLAIGAGCMLVYGSYVSEDTNIASTGSIIAGINVLVAILVGIAIFPIIFSYKLVPTSGPGLIFEVLPIAFSHMVYGQIFSTIFFALILFAAWTSSISMAEPIVVTLIEQAKCTRKKAAIYVGIITWSLGIFSVLSFNYWENIRLFGQWNIFNFITDLATNILLPIGILGYTIFTGWAVNKPLLQKAFKNQTLFCSWFFILKYIAPILVAVIIVQAVFSL